MRFFDSGNEPLRGPPTTPAASKKRTEASPPRPGAAHEVVANERGAAEPRDGAARVSSINPAKCHIARLRIER